MENDAIFDMLFNNMKNNDEREAYHRLFNAFYAPLCVLADRLLNDKDTAKDTVVDVFVYLWENRKHIELTASIRIHLMTCTRNRCLNHLKHNGVHKKYADYVQRQETTDKATDELLIYDELQEKLNEVLDRMPEAYKIAFVMSKLHEERTHAIAKRLHISERTVERMKLKAQHIIKTELKKFYPFILAWLTIHT